MSRVGREMLSATGAKAENAQACLVILLELVALLLRAVAPDGRDVEHALAELNERPALDRDVLRRRESEERCIAQSLPLSSESAQGVWRRRAFSPAFSPECQRDGQLQRSTLTRSAM